MTYKSTFACSHFCRWLFLVSFFRSKLSDKWNFLYPFELFGNYNLFTNKTFYAISIWLIEMRLHKRIIFVVVLYTSIRRQIKPLLWKMNSKYNKMLVNKGLIEWRKQYSLKGINEQILPEHIEIENYDHRKLSDIFACIWIL